MIQALQECCFSKAVFTLGKVSAIMPASTTHDSDTLVLALATLGGTTNIEMILSVLHCPRWPRQVRQWHKIPDSFATNLTNVNDPMNQLVNLEPG
jgi:hypothetical protein